MRLAMQVIPLSTMCMNLPKLPYLAMCRSRRRKPRVSSVGGEVGNFVNADPDLGGLEIETAGRGFTNPAATSSTTFPHWTRRPRSCFCVPLGAPEGLKS